MAEEEQQTEGDEIPSAVELLIWMNEIGNHPVTVPLDYDACIGGNLTPDARDLLKVATAQRLSMQEGLSYADSKVDPRNVVAATEAYLPSVWRITASMEASSDVHIKLKKKVEFQWTSQLSKVSSKKKEIWKFGVLVFEVAYTLMIRSIAHLDTAHALLQSSKQSASSLKLVEATAELRKGAGIQDYVAKDLLPRWVNPPPKRPHEVLPQVVSTLSSLFQADAQRLAIAKAIIGKSPASLIAKLIIGCIGKYDLAVRILRTLSKEEFEAINDCIRDELGTMPAILRALASKYMGIACHEKEKWGQAAAFMQEATRRFDTLVLGASMEKALKGALREEAKVVKALAREYTEECSSVYFEAIPSAGTLEFPDGTFIIKPTEYVIPDLPIVSFAEEAPKKEEPKADASSAAAGEASKTTRGFFSLLSRGKKESADDKKLKPPPGLDPEAFAALPEEIQKEVVHQYETEAAAKGTAV